MSPQITSVIGVILMAFCGSAIGRHMGLVGLDQIYIAGFALGIVIFGQVSSISLHKRIAALGEKLALQSHP